LANELRARGDGLDLLGQQRIDGAFGIGGRQRAIDMAAMVDALVDHLAQVALDQRHGLGPGEVVELGHAQGADLQHVAEALGGDQTNAGALVLDGVGGDGGAVAYFVQAQARCGLAEELAQAFHDGPGVVVDAGGDFLGMDGAVAAEQDDVGERAADVDADAIGDVAGHTATPPPAASAQGRAIGFSAPRSSRVGAGCRRDGAR
jgi:hypothetical protein